jgi:hypothetical protein
MTIQCLQTSQNLIGSIGVFKYTVREIGAGQMKLILGDSFAFVAEVETGFIAEQVFNF